MPKPKQYKPLSVKEIEARCHAAGVPLGTFWKHAMGGDQAALPKLVVDRVLRQLR